MSLKDKTIVVTGGSRGLGLGLVEALVDQGSKVTVVARGADALGSVSARLGVATIAADIVDETAAHRIIAEVRPDILVLNAGAEPRMGRLDEVSWADFTATWETDVKAGLYWLQAALNLPLKPGSRVLVAVVVLAAGLQALQTMIRSIEKRIVVQHRSSAASKRLETIPGIGVIGASAIAATVPDPKVFRSGRDLAAWIGLVPREDSTGGKQKLGPISKQGDRYLRVAGGPAIIL